jgi:seryl-tRNA synthetase
VTTTRERRTFDVSKASDGCVRALLDGLRLDRENVRDVNLEQSAGVLQVELTDAGAAEHVEAFVANMMRTHRRISRKVLKENRATSLRFHDIDAGLAESGDVLILGDGLTGLRGQLLSLFRFFEREFLKLAREFRAEEHQYPAMVPGEVLVEVGYFDHFPQHVTFCSHLPANLPLLESLASDLKAGGGRLTERLGGQLAEPRHVLTPGVCLPCYRQQRGVMLEPGRVRTLTMQNHVFRYEGASFRPLTRAWDFTVRDIVFFGSYEELSRLRSEVIDRALGLCRELDLEVTVELAHDPFFLDASRDKAIYQRMGEVKYELLFQLPHRGETLAASSFNLHRDFYTSVYDTRRADGELAESACMGFGIERWLYGFLSQKGLDPSGWPPRVTSAPE